MLKQKKMDKDAAAKPVLARYMANTASEPTNPMVTPKRKSGVSIDDSPMHLSTPATSAAGVDAVRRRSSLTTMPSMVHKPSFDTPNPHIVHLEHKVWSYYSVFRWMITVTTLHIAMSSLTSRNS